jgi:large subunit ribosomal protein L21
MFAVLRTGGKQYRVAAGDKIVVEKLAGEAGDTVTLGDILLAGEGAELRSTDGLTVSAEIIAQAKGDKVIVFKKRRRHNYRRKKGHRQQHTILRILGIGDQQAQGSEGGQEAAPAKKSRAKKADAAPAEAPLKVDGAESRMTDSPVEAKNEAADAPAAAEAHPQAPLKNDGAESEMTDSPVAAKKPRKKKAE